MNQLENALLNLCINARDAMPDGGTLTIETGNRLLQPSEAKDLELLGTDHVSLGVSDTGGGMATDVIERAFDPFFTTKTIGEGTTVRLYLPRYIGDQRIVPAPGGSRDVRRGAAGLHILESQQRVELLVTDVGLPGGMNGRQLADAALVTRPNLKIILTKPFSLETLGCRIQESIAAIE